MHRYRSWARQSAWYDNEGEPSTHNPFKKFRANKRVSTNTARQLEMGTLARSATEGNIESPAETRRRIELSEGVVPLGHPDTWSQPSGSRELDFGDADNVSAMASSQDPINRGLDDDNDNQPRRRKNTPNSDGETLTTPYEKDDEDDGHKPHFTVGGQLRATVFNSWINVLLVCVPVGIALNYTNVDRTAVFVVNFIGIIPLAAMLSYATEEVAFRTGETLGGLLNATFGNAVELIVAIIALVDRDVTIVQTSLVGSMLSNLLLVMGMCFFFGGINRISQNFNEVVAQTAASLLALAIASLIIPTAFRKWAAGGAEHTDELSRGTSVILLLVYGAYLFFQLKSHTEIYNKPSEKSEKRKKNRVEGDTQKGLAAMGGLGASVSGKPVQPELPEEEEDKEEPQLHFYVAILTLVISTVLVALCAEFMVDAIDAITSGNSGISKTFVGLILLPIVGNAAEHATAVTVACKDKMDLAIGVAVGSSMQIALLVLPLIVVIGWIMGVDDMTLDFGDGFQVTVLFVTVLLVNYLIADGKSHWLEGVLLMTLYLIIAIAAWFYD
ncbi:Vacuolar calcium ion transporter [Talaromyces islandicus]|uniref:Vacuolar calcium ion transporter n=1 Tax=Talaromyces islandicus TaxID=28573 RepID=A0A0U1M6D4_TALIS|nr:Vacuolar calcium ion transporter [Talaromyces islandicus]